MRVLVTGKEGFTGKYVEKELLSKGHEVIGLTADITDIAALSNELRDSKLDAVIHLAAIAFVGHGDVNDIYQVNLIGTRNLLSVIAEHLPDIQSILLASSANVYGNTEGVLSEMAVLKPENDYAVSKASMEAMAKLWMPKLPIFIVRPFNYTGRGQDKQFLIPKIVSHFRNKSERIELGNLDVRRDFGDVRDVAKDYCALIESPPVGQVINVCTGKMQSLKDVIDLATNISGHNIVVDVNPAFVRENEVKQLCGDPATLNDILGVRSRIIFKETLQWMLDE